MQSSTGMELTQSLTCGWNSLTAIKTNLCGLYPIAEDGHALSVKQPGLRVEFNEDATSDTPFKLRKMPNLSTPDRSARD